MLRPEDYTAPLDRAAEHARRWLASIPSRHVGPRATADELAEAFGGPLPETGLDPAGTVDELAAAAEPGLMAMLSGRFYGWVIGGTLPAAMAADWLVSAWDQNTGLRFATPAVVAAEEAAGRWVLDLLRLPTSADVGFTTGASMATAPPSSVSRPGTSTRARSIPSRRRSRPFVGIATARGSTSTARSGCGRPHPARRGTSYAAPRRPTRGGPTSVAALRVALAATEGL